MSKDLSSEMAVVREMLRSFRDETFPEFRRHLDSVHESMKKQHEQHAKKIEELEKYIDTQKGSLSVWKWIVSVLGLSNLAQWLNDIFSNLPQK